MHKIADIAAGIIVLATIFVLVRPRSQGPNFVASIGNSFANVIGAATCGGGF